MADHAEPAEDWAALIDELGQHGTHCRPYADTTKRNLEFIVKKWEQFCFDANLGEPLHALQSGNASYFKAFFQWMIKTAERKAQQAVSLRQYFRRLRQAYEDATAAGLDESVVRDVNAYIEYHAQGKHESAPRPKPVPSGTDFVKMLHFLYLEDSTRYPDERQRVQQGFLMIIHAYSGLRPSSTTQSSKGKRADSNVESWEEDEQLAKLRYGDFTLVLVNDDKGRPRFGVRPFFKRFKGENRRAQRKRFTWFDQADVLTCPVAHLVALALHDNAFKQAGLNNAHSVFSLALPGGVNQLTLHWRDDLTNKPIFRTSTSGLRERELSASVASKRLKSLGEKMGFRESLTWYCLRRLVLNAVDGFGSEETRNQVSGHLDSRTYRTSYQDQNITLDVASLVRGQDTEDMLMQKLNHMGADADPGANIPLSPEAHAKIAMLPDVVALETAYNDLAGTLKDTYGSMRNAPESDTIRQDSIKAQRRLRARKELHRKRILSQRRKDFFTDKDDALIEAQLNAAGATIAGSSQRKPWSIKIPERAALASFIGKGSITPSQRAAAVQTMAELCDRVDAGRYPKDTGSQPVQNLSTKSEDETQDYESIPMQCQTLQCLFCLGDERLVFADRTRTFNRQQALWKHVKKHLDAIVLHSRIACPHPTCKAQGLTFDDVQHLKNHAHKAHNVRLQHR